MFQGVLFAWLASFIPLNLEAIEHWMEILVGLSLVAIGLVGIFDARAAAKEVDAARRSTAADKSPAVASEHSFDSKRPLQAILSGVLMGAGSGGHLVGMTPALSMGSRQVTFFLVAFAAGMAVAMAAFMGALGAASRALVRRGGHVPPAHVISLFVSCISIVIGVYYTFTSWTVAPERGEL